MEKRGGARRGFSESSGVEDAGYRYGVLALPFVGVLRAQGVAGGALKGSRPIRVLTRARRSPRKACL